MIVTIPGLPSLQIAAENGLPCVYIVDSGGAFLPLQSEIFPDAKHGGRSFANQAVMSANGVPQVSPKPDDLLFVFCTLTGDFFVHLCGKDSTAKSRKIEFLKKILEFLTKILPDDVIITIKK